MGNMLAEVQSFAQNILGFSVDIAAGEPNSAGAARQNVSPAPGFLLVLCESALEPA